MKSILTLAVSTYSAYSHDIVRKKPSSGGTNLGIGSDKFSKKCPPLSSSLDDKRFISSLRMRTLNIRD
jgi:hypothetical protein